MSRDIFGQQDARRGGKVPTQREWNGMNQALTNVEYGDNGFEFSDVTEEGTIIPSDSFFFQHVAFVSYNYTDAIIGPDREEDYYPYIDSMSVERRYEEWIFTLENGQYKKYDGLDSSTSMRSVLFKLPNTIEPTKPADNMDGAIVGYSWELTPVVTDVSFLADGAKMIVDIEWIPGAVFEDDPQASMYTIDSGVSESSWAPASGFVNAGTYVGETLINDWLSSNDPANYPIDIGDLSEAILDESLADISITVPVARFDWDNSQLKLERRTQLLFGSNAPGAGGGGGGGVQQAGINHPFKAMVKPDYPDTIEVGYLRPDFKDSINIEDPETDLTYAIEFAAAEDILLDTVDYYIYYDIYKNGTVWEATLEKSATWPPTVETGNVIIQVGFAEYDSGNSTYIWYQHLYECPRETIQAIRGEFEPWYQLDGSVTIASGTVSTFNNNTATIPEEDFDLAVDTEMWVTATSTRSAGAPSVVIGGLNSGTYPGMFVSLSDSVKTFNYKIGEIVNKKYIPAHKGKLHIDNTLLQPLITDDYTAATDHPRMLLIHDDQETEIGDVTNDLLIDAKLADVTIIGGGVEAIVESTEVKIYGLTQDETGLEMMATSGVNGTGYGTGSISLTPQDLDYDVERGLAQAIDFADGTVAKIEAGDNVQIDYADGVATIKARPESTHVEITVITDAQLDSNNDLQIKTRTIEVVNPSVESAWTTVTGWTTDEC